jgi:hypothetical protein
VADDSPWDDIWRDQAEFNSLFRALPDTPEGKGQLTSDMVVSLTSEAHELLRTTLWKKHRRSRKFEPNLPHTVEEIVDMFKFFISICHIWGVTPDALMEGYWRKSAVCRQRYSEEWVKGHVTEPTIILDLDNVLCDYIKGLGQWLIGHSGFYMDGFRERVTMQMAAQGELNAVTLGVPVPQWEELKHRFRVSGQKEFLPLMPAAWEFAKWCRARALVVLLTARPIDRYPNMMTDTVAWLQRNDILVDHIWWAADKGEVVQLEEIRQHVLFAVDDNPKHIGEYTAAGVRSYWLCGQSPSFDITGQLHTPVTSLREIMKKEG